MRFARHTLEYDTGQGIQLSEITGQVAALVDESGIRDGLVTLSSPHTTAAITVNENESRLFDDVRRFFAELAPPDRPYRHNDIALRDCPPDEPLNAHSHLLAMLVGSSETIPLVDGRLDLGHWQSILLLELDGPRRRILKLQIMGD